MDRIDLVDDDMKESGEKSVLGLAPCIGNAYRWASFQHLNQALHYKAFTVAK